MTEPLTLPSELLPADGRFGAGPSKVRQEAVQRLTESAPHLLGTSHRQAAVKHLVRRVREGLAEFFDLPHGYEIALGNGGATLFWDAAVVGLIRQRSAHAVFGEFSSKFAKAVEAAPFLDDPVRYEAEFGAYPAVPATEGVDAYALTHCETSTGVAMPPTRPADDGLVLVDATSAAGGMDFDLAEVDAYYFSPQKGFGSEGGLWAALLSPAALARLEETADTGRHIPAMLDIRLALENTTKDQTYNTPAITTLFLMADQLEWMNAQGGLDWAAKDCAAKAGMIYEWAEQSEVAAPFVSDPAQRSDVVCTVDIDEAVSADEVNATLRANGILDTDGYRKLGRNQLRIAVYPAVDQGDVERLLSCIDHVIERLRG